MTGAYRELPYVPDDLYSAADAITSAMGIDLPEDELRHLLRDARHAHRLVLSEWMRRNIDEWKPPRHLPRASGVYDHYDYGEWSGLGFDDHRWIDRKTGKEYFGWDAWWRENWGKGLGNPGKFRGSDVPAPPLVAIYRLVNRFWRDVMRLDFHPDFTGQYAADTDAARFPDLNLAAQIFLLIAQDAGGAQYNCNLCGRVHDAYYRQLDRSFPESP